MAVDLYVGSLARYYAGSWENKAQQYARENNLSYNVIRPEQTSEEAIPSSEEIVEIVQGWFSSLSKGFNIDFNLLEEFQGSYFTERIENFELLFSANCLLHLPDEDAEKLSNQKGMNDIQKKIEKSLTFVHLNNIEVWFPVDLPGSGIYEIEFPNEQKKTVCSVSLLIKEIDAISKKIFNHFISDLDSEFPAELTYLRDDLLKIYHGAIFSLENKLPIILDC